jgi:hypothetical protein
MATVTLAGCNPVAYGYIESQCPPGVSVVSPRPVERRDTIINLVPITINIDASAVVTVGSMALAAWIARMVAFAKANPNADVDSNKVTVIDEPKMAKALEDSVARRIENKK